MHSSKTCATCKQFLLDDVTPHTSLSDCFDAMARRISALEHKEKSREWSENHVYRTRNP